MKHAVKSTAGKHAGISRWSRSAQPRIHGVATYEWNMLNGTTWYSPEWSAMSGTDDYDWTRPNNEEWWNKRVHPDDMPLLQRTCLALLAGFVNKAELTYRFKRADGVWLWLHSQSQITEWTPDGAPAVLSGVCMDISSSLSLWAPKSQSSVSDFDYHSMLENSPDLFVRLNRDLRPVYVNPVIARYLDNQDEGRGLTDTLGSLRITGDYLDLLRENVERVFRDKAIARESLSFTLPGGRQVSGECSFWPEYDAEGNVRYAMAQFRDLTEQRRMEQRNALYEKRLEALYRLSCMEHCSEVEVLQFVMDSVLSLTNSRSGFFFIPEEDGSDRGYLLWSGDHYDTLETRYLPNDFMPHDLIIQVTGPDGKRRYRSINNGDGVNPLFVVFDGKMSVMRGITAPGMENNRVVCIAGVCNKDSEYEESDLQQLEIFINSAWLILRRRRFVRELREAKETAESANRAKNTFLANVSHELRTPLNGVLGMLQLIDAMDLGKQQREYLQTAQHSGKALLRIISDLLDYSCMESGQMSLDAEVFAFRETVESALNVFESDARKKGLDFLRVIDPAIPRYLVGDEARLRQVVFNLVGNALKFTDTGTVTVFCSRVCDPPEGKAGISLTVKDTGVGIRKDMLDGIFVAFARESGSRRRRYPGTGLGLSIVSRLAAMMHGSVVVQSEPDQGTSIVCTLFFDLPSSAGAEGGNARVRVPAGSGVPLDILVAEDDMVGRFAINAFLQQMGHRVVCVEDGLKALEALRLYPFHCLFTDIEMPHVDGLELTRRIRGGDGEVFPVSPEIAAMVKEAIPEATKSFGRIDPDITVVAVSAHTMIGDRERFLTQGVNYFISKPILREELSGALDFVFRQLQRKAL